MDLATLGNECFCQERYALKRTEPPRMSHLAIFINRQNSSSFLEAGRCTKREKSSAP